MAVLVSMVRCPNGELTPCEKCFLRNPHFIFCPPFPNLRLGRITFWLQKLKSALKTHSVSEFYPSQTKILEGGTKDEMRIFEALFNGSWPKLSTHALEKCFLRNPDFLFCSSFQIFVWGPSETLVRPSQFIVWNRVEVVFKVAGISRFGCEYLVASFVPASFPNEEKMQSG